MGSQTLNTQTFQVRLDAGDPEGMAVSIVSAMGPLIAAGAAKCESVEQSALFWLSMIAGVAGCMIGDVGPEAARRVLDAAAGVMDAAGVGRTN